MSKKHGGPKPQYSNVFKTQLVSESRVTGVTVPMVSRRYKVPCHQIYAWRLDDRFQGEVSDPSVFTAVEVTDDIGTVEKHQTGSEVWIDITLENGRQFSISGEANTDFIVALARGLAA